MITGVRTIRSVVPGGDQAGGAQSAQGGCSGSPRAASDALRVRRARRRRAGTAFTAGIRPGAMLSSRTPSSTSRSAASGSPASSPHTPTQRPCASAAAVTEAISAQHRLQRRLQQPRQRRVAALGRHRVLGRGRWCRSRRSPRAGRADRPASAAAGTSIIAPTSSCAVAAERFARGVEQPARGLQLGHGRDHREHHRQRVLGRHAQDRAQLRREQLRLLQRQPDAAPAEERVGLRLGGQERQRLVGAGVERADDQRPAVQAARRSRSAPRPARPRSAARRGRGRGTRCAAARRPRRLARPPARASRGAADVGEHLDAPAVREHDGLGRALPALRRGWRRRASRRCSKAAARGASGSIVTAPASPSSASVAPSCDREQRRSEPDDQRDPERPGDDRGVVERPAAGGGDAPRGRGVEVRDRARRQLVGDDDAGLGRRARGSRADELGQHAVARRRGRRSPGHAGTGRRCRRRRAATSSAACLNARAAGSPAATAAWAGSISAASSSSSVCAAKISASPARQPRRGRGELLARDVERGGEPLAPPPRASRRRPRRGRTPRACDQRAGPIARPRTAVDAAQRRAPGARPGGAWRRARGGRGVAARAPALAARRPARRRSSPAASARSAASSSLRLRAARGDLELVALHGAQQRQPGQAAPVGGAGAARRVAQLDRRVVAGDELDDPPRRADVQPEAVADVQRARRAPRRRPAPPPRARRASSSSSCDVFITSAPRASAATSASVGAAARARRRGDRALDQRRGGEHDRPAVLLEHLERDLRAHQRAAQVHQHEHAIGRAHALDRPRARARRRCRSRRRRARPPARWRPRRRPSGAPARPSPRPAARCARR